MFIYIHNDIAAETRICWESVRYVTSNNPWLKSKVVFKNGDEEEFIESPEEIKNMVKNNLLLDATT